MIISASYRTDIPAFYGAWFARRLAAGFAMVTNPYGSAPYRVALDPGNAAGFVFWTRNVQPFLPVVTDLAYAGRPFVVQFTVTGYPRAVETAVIDPARAVAQIIALAAQFGPQTAVWRYDPILQSDLTPLQFHRENFARLADRLAGAVDEVVVSFAHIYRKTARNLNHRAAAGGFGWHDPATAEKQALLADLLVLAAERGLRLTLCAQPELLIDGVAPARCIDAGRLGIVNARRKGNRPGCQCAESRDIGAYDTCPHGCAYCYAVTNRDAARRKYRDHDAQAPRL